MIERSLYVIDRDRVTCAGGTAPLDLMHALIARHHGAPFARLVSDWFMHTEIRPSIGPQRGGLVERVGSTNAAILDAVDAMESHVAEPISLGRPGRGGGHIAAAAEPAFPRESSGRSTMGYYRELRLDKAQSLLRHSPLSPDRDRAGDRLCQLLAFLARLHPAFRPTALGQSLTELAQRCGLRLRVGQNSEGPMHILVLQHERVEHPGIFRDFLKEDGHTWDAVELDEGETIASA